MSDGITDATRTDQQILDDWKKRELQKFLSSLSTPELVAELSKREGVKEIVVDPYIQYSITTYAKQEPYTFLASLTAHGGTGAARILVVID